ncbi:Chain length determinant protein [Rubripirellula amarantea]|uniref:Chain length determinant protein n=1 Tax=Rubripirellula amarantea TaxID=2527999 RepID=A0A5C5WQF0_9BACT|nr:exopolysaccharide biosynthesis protein [Rubripirellula amarantea]TWT52505.1 Chain length determinant protein [Rubripirellula amarantea]
MDRNDQSSQPRPSRENRTGDSRSSESWATLTPADLIRSVSRRLPSVLVTTLLVAIAVAAILVAWPNQYSSDGMFYVRLGRGAVSIDPTTEPTRSVSLQESRTSEVMSISQMLNSREIADRVVRTVGARAINHPRNWVERLTRIANESSADVEENDERIKYEHQIAHEEAVKKVLKSVSINVPKDSYTVSVTAKGSDPLLAQQIVQAFMDEYGAYHVEAHRSNGSLDFFEKQTKASQSAALNARKALQEARGQMGWLSSESSEKALGERIIELELALDQAESSYAESQSRTAALKQQLAQVQEWVPMEVSRVANEAAFGMRTYLYEAQMEDGEKLSKVTSNHPRYKILQQKINQGNQIVDAAGDEREQTTEALNPIRIKLESEFQTAFAENAGLKSRLESLQASMEQAKADLRRLNEDAIKLAELSWTADIAEENFLAHAKSLESSRVTHELDKQEMSDVSVIQNASLNLKKVGPPRLALGVVGMMLGFCIGVLQALIRDNPIATRDAQEVSTAPEQRARHYGEDDNDYFVTPPKRTNRDALTSAEREFAQADQARHDLTVHSSSKPGPVVKGEKKQDEWVSMPR